MFHKIVFVLALNFVAVKTLQKDLEAVYWEIRPFFYMENGQTKGMIAEYFHQLRLYCLSHQQLLHLQSKQENEQKFVNLLTDLTKRYKTGQLLNVTQKKAVWFPMTTIINETILDARNVRQDVLFFSPYIALVVKRDKIVIQYKLVIGILSCGQLFLTAAMLGVIYSMSIWLSVSINF